MEKYFQELREIKEELKSLKANQQEYLALSEAASYLHISTSTLYKHTSNHTIPFYRPNGKLILFKKSELDEWLTKNRVSVTNQFKTDTHGK